MSRGRKTIASAATNGFEQNAVLHDKANLEEAPFVSIFWSNFGCNCLEFFRFVSVNVHHQITNKTFFIGCMTKQISGRGNLTGSSLDLAASQLVYRIHPTTTIAKGCRKKNAIFFFDFGSLFWLLFDLRMTLTPYKHLKKTCC